MATKTLTITEDAYDMLVERKLDNESFSEEIKRICLKRGRKGLMDFFGILSKEEGDKIEKVLEKRRELNINLRKERYGF